MRYLMMVKGDCENRPPNADLAAGMGQLIAQMRQAGALLACEGLAPASQGMRLHYGNGRRSVIDGPFTEAKELVGGFAILRADSREEALALAQRMIDVHVQAGIEEVAVEIRPMLDSPPPAG